MKIAFVFLLLAAVFASESAVTDGPTVEDFLKGFLKGIGEEKSIDDLRKCIHNIQDIMKRISDALKLILTFEFDNVFEGITQLIAAIRDFNRAVQPCLEGYNVLAKLLKAIGQADIGRMVRKILQDPFTFIGLIREAIRCHREKMFECFGLNLGSLLKMLFLDETLVEAL
eukprot:TRINITY_DN5371_c0_g1_i1.p1 TRINITY_DN5371_c0_g1~~TRINITY_DN5371_c0_g1_i1.p1  ORF type:complete len:170 (-),score=56.05 TRINITY_DN5371_c0_g1_i1:102-611(-)